MALKLRDDQLRDVFARLRVLLVDGADDAKIAKTLKMSWPDVMELKRIFYDHESEILRGRSTEHTYVRYVIEQRQNLSALDKVVGDYQKQKNVSAFVSAIKAKSDILDRVLKTGQELGLIERLAKGEGYAAGQAIKNMTNIEFRQLVIATVSDFNDLMARFGDKTIVEMLPGPLHRPARKAKQPVKAHGRTKVHGGRRVVKGESS